MLTTRLPPILLAALILALQGCEAILTDPAPAPGMRVNVSLHPHRAGFTEDGLGLPEWGVRELWLHLDRGDSWRDTLVLARLEQDRLLAPVWFRADELSGPLEIRAEIRLASGLPLFAGTASAENLGIAPSLNIELTPRPVLASLPSQYALGLSTLDGASYTQHVIPRSVMLDISPRDGTVVVSRSEIHLIDPYSGESRALFDSTDEQLPVQQQDPQFSGNGKWIYFMGSIRESFTSERTLWRVRPDGSDAEPVLEPDARFNEIDRPAPSYDGTRVAFVYNPESYASDSLAVMNVATKTITRLGVSNVSRMRWSPDDEWIAYVSDIPGIALPLQENRLHVVRPDGTDHRVVAPDLAIGSVFDWTADSGHVVATTPNSYAVLVDVATGDLEILSDVGRPFAVAASP